MSHRKPRPSRNPLTSKAFRLGLLAAGIATAAAAAPAQAAAPRSHIPRDVAVANDGAHTHANQLHHTQVQDTLTVHQFGSVIAAGVRNQANAISSGCSVDDHCRSIALSFQVVTMAGTHTHLNAVNLSDAVNKHCDGCQTLAGAYQFVVSTPRPFTLDSTARRGLADVHRRLDALTRSKDCAADLQKQVDQLAAEVKAILKSAVDSADYAPDVAVHRHFDGGWR
jgi:hypothetical protein